MQSGGFIDYGEPLKIHELNVEGLVQQLADSGVRTSSAKVGGLTPTQLNICNDPARFKVVACGRRFGKSILCTLVAAAVALQAGRKIWIVSDTYSLADKVFAELWHLFVVELKLAQYKDKGERYIKLTNGSQIWGKSCEHRNSLVGESLDLLVWDETALTARGPELWEQELRPTLMDRKGSAMFISTPRGQNHFYDWYLLGQEGMKIREALEAGTRKEEDLTEEEQACIMWSSFRFSSYYNTKAYGGYLDKEEIDLARLNTPELRFRQEYLADFTAVADGVFPEFNPEEQIVDWPTHDSLPVVTAMDFNYQTPCTTLYAQIDPNLNIYIFDEYHPKEAHKTVHQQARQMLDKDKEIGGRIVRVVADKAGEQKQRDGRSAWDDLGDWGIYPHGKKQKIETGCDLIRLWCKYPRVDQNGLPLLDENGEVVTYSKLHMSPRCKSLIFAMQAARAAEGKDGVPKEGYRKDGKVDGPLDALRYLLVDLLHDSDGVMILPVS